MGNKESLVRPNSTATVYNYDSLNRLKGMATRKGTLAQAVAGTAPLVSRFDYHVRADGRRDQLTEAIAHPDGSNVTRTVNYGFDLANRLTSESGSNGEGKSYSKSYELDAAGNRKSLTEMREGQLYAQTSYGYNSLDWLTGTQTQTKDATSNVAYDYDANGAQISQTTGSGAQSQTTGQKWDFEGHLLASGAVNAQGQWSGNRSTYSYDASGMRLSQASWNAAGAATDGTSYVWYGDRVTEERDEKGVLQAVYEHGQELGPLRLVRRAGTVAAPVEQERYFIGDGQDSTRQLLDENGVVKDSYFYDAFGVGLPGGQGATENSFKYTGQQQDASGLYYLRARFYNAGTGRFLSQDPEMGSAMDPVSMHRYLYAGADPVNMVDPSGREFSLAGALTSIGVSTTMVAPMASAISTAFTVVSAIGTAGAAYNIMSDVSAGASPDPWDFVDVVTAALPLFGKALTSVGKVGSRWAVMGFAKFMKMRRAGQALHDGAGFYKTVVPSVIRDMGAVLKGIEEEKEEIKKIVEELMALRDDSMEGLNSIDEIEGGVDSILKFFKKSDKAYDKTKWGTVDTNDNGGYFVGVYRDFLDKAYHATTLEEIHHFRQILEKVRDGELIYGELPERAIAIKMEEEAAEFLGRNGVHKVIDTKNGRFGGYKE